MSPLALRAPKADDALPVAGAGTRNETRKSTLLLIHAQPG